MAVNAPGDIYEQEADRVASRVMRLTDDSLAIREHSAPEAQRICKDCDEERVQRQEETGPVARSGNARAADGSLAHGDDGYPGSPTIQPATLTSGGTPLSAPVRSFYEERFGCDFGTVRVHTGAAAARMTSDLHARAFTYGSHIWLGAGERPSPSFCLAHELVHVVQQTRPHNVPGRGAANPSAGRAETHGRRPPAGMVQRQDDLYWVAEEYYARKGNTGKEIQDDIYASRAGATDASEEVRVPNGARMKFSEDSEWGLHVKNGVADLYRADRQLQVGVYFDENHTPNRLAVKRGLTARPIVERGKLTGTGDGPTWVRIGEIKPATAGMIASGKKQVANYLEGIRLAGRETNDWASRNNADPWPLDPGNVEAMTAKDFTPHQDHTPGSATGTLYELILVEWNMEDRKPKPVLFPRRDLGAPVEGRMYVNEFSGGVWAYHFDPTNLAALLTDPATRRRLRTTQAQAIDFAQALQSSVIDPITNAPVQAMTLRWGDARTTDVGIQQRATPHIQRADKEPPRLRDTFPLEQVIEARGRLRTQFTREKETEPFRALRRIGQLYQAEAALTKAGVSVRHRLPDERQLSLTLKTRSGAKTAGPKGGGSKAVGTTSEAVSSVFRWFEVWTHPAINTLARFRKIFGTTFVTVGTKIRAVKERIATKLKDTFEKHAGSDAKGTSYGAVALRAIARALKAIGGIIIPQTLRLIVHSLIDGVKAKLRQVIPLDVDSLERAVANEFDAFRVVQEKIESLRNTVESEVGSIIETLSDKLAGIREVIAIASKVADTVKWTVRLLQCGTPPGWGCLKLLLSSLTAYIAEKVLSSCSLQREVACLTSAVDFVRTGIPKVIASAIIDKLNDLVGAIDPRLAPLFADITDVPSLNCNEIGCEGGRSEMDQAFDRMRAELERKHGILGAAWLMDSLFEMSHLSGAKEGDELTAAEVNELTTLLMSHNVSPAELQMVVLRLRQQLESGKPAQKVTPQELMDEIERERQLLMGGDTPTTHDQPAGAGPGGGTAPGSPTGPGGATGPGGGPSGETEAGEGGGLSTVTASQARFDGTIGNRLSRTNISVENPDAGAHKPGKATVTLVGSIDDEPVQRVADVPVTIEKHARAKARGRVVIPYQLEQGVCFTHAVQGVPRFCLDKGKTIRMTVEKAVKKAKPVRK